MASSLTAFQQNPADTLPQLTERRKEGLGNAKLCGIKTPEGKKSSDFLI